MSSGIRVREAGLDEQEMVLHQRRSMFRDMGEGTADELDRMVEAARPWLAEAMREGTYRHWLAVDHHGRVAGGGGVLLTSWPPNPLDASAERAIILNVYTEPEFRRRGVAKAIMREVLAWIQARGLRAANLHASAEGRHLYEKLGFEATNEMRLRFTRNGASQSGTECCE